ncbi:hypothetical protein VSDG_05383 [Cytospora chrysosperma]|uniref:UDENN FLCN/SMCR8-type domain-containing protein n=1 Tax=Cytospora chrysosperma TaxID=252740 RepID=A0A423VX08_CYTCH|nr:hypothetical protein VSDG_05383 [Valsa sordida]
MILIPGVQLCLAHYCDVHGPTPLMVTEGLPVPCSACYEDASYADSDRPPSGASTPSSSIHSSAAITEALKKLSVDSKRNRSTAQDGPANRAAPRRTNQLSSTSALDTPPASPRQPTDLSSSQTGGPLARRESSYRRTYDETVTKRAGPCDNCALTLPKRQESTSRGAGADAGPTLRTRAPYARVYGSGLPGDASPTNSASTISDEDEQPRGPSHRRSGTLTSATSRSSSSSNLNGHTHYLDYTSTHEPVVPSSFSIVRASCIRTLSFETLPRNTATNAGNAPLSPTTPGFVTTHSPGAATSGGPIFFGDPSAGYTTAYIFRIPDVHARGHKRVYAFLALSTHRERLAMKTFNFLSNAFRELASWIQGLAEAEAERYANDSSAAGSPLSAGSIYGGGPGAGAGMSQPQSQQGQQPVENNNTTGSGFLSSGMGGLSRRMGGGYGAGGVSIKARGLAELVGLPDFFIELHSRFVQLLFELGVVLSS